MIFQSLFFIIAVIVIGVALRVWAVLDLLKTELAGPERAKWW